MHIIENTKLTILFVFSSVSGIGGNLVAIQASRISTYLHLHSIPGELPDEPKGCYYPFRTFFGPGRCLWIFAYFIPGTLPLYEYRQATYVEYIFCL